MAVFWATALILPRVDAPSAWPPTEARLHPDLWGYIRFLKKKPDPNEWMYDPMLLNPELDAEDENEGSIFDLDF